MSKRASGVFIQRSPPPDAHKVARRVWVYRAVLESIMRGSLPPGARLPAARQLASDWSVARGAVDDAFEQLQIEGYLQRRVGDGTYVASPLPHLPVGAPAAPGMKRPLSQTAQHVLDRFAPYLGKPRQLEQAITVLTPMPLFARAPLTEGFALDVWRRLMVRALGDAHRDMLDYGPAAGLDTLRESIARHVSLTRGTACAAEQVLVVNSPMQGIELIARVLLEPGDTVWVEEPGHGSLPTLFEVLHARVCPVPLDLRGFNTALGRSLAPHAAAVYLHPQTQFPLGTVTDSERRAELLQWADEQAAWVIEGNFNDELSLGTSQPLSLQRLDRSDRVLLMGTFEGLMFPSLRVAYLVLPTHLVPVFAAMRGLLGDHTSMPTQLALSWFIDDGHLSSRIRDLRRKLQRRTQALCAAVRRHVPDWASLGSLDGGTHACLHLPTDVSDMDAASAVRKLGVLVIALSSVSLRPQGRNALVLGHGPFDEDTIERAVAVIGRALRSLRVGRAMPAYQPTGDNR